jgi:hypothetical protein
MTYSKCALTESQAEEEPALATTPAARILIVDDNKDAPDSLAALLALEGHTIEIAYAQVETLRPTWSSAW